jgi:hypothetical protein|tara:strand:- start:205 stop:357 length:153 start_codon:yes stop_codon:yes gene_type:complete
MSKKMKSGQEAKLKSMRMAWNIEWAFSVWVDYCDKSSLIVDKRILANKRT